LTYLGPHKAQGYENIPSTKEVYGIEIPDLLAIIGPKGLPDNVVKTLEAACAKAIKDPEFIKMMERLYMPVLYMDRLTVKKYVDETFANTAKIYEKLKAEEKQDKK